MSVAALNFPYPEPPTPGATIEVAPGVLWTRVRLPFRLDHINVFCVDDGDGWAIIDTGIDNAETRAAWDALLKGPLGGRRVTKIIVTHYHPDHIGLAGWLAQRCNAPVLTSLSSWLGCLNISLRPGPGDESVFRDFYLSHGLDAETTAVVATHGHGYLKMVSTLPPTFERLVAGDRLTLGGRVFDVLSGDGHSPEQLMFVARDEPMFFVADQVLAKITPNVSVWSTEPRGDPLGLYLRSLRALIADVSDTCLVLPGHQLPFQGLHTRAREIIDHHESRCALIAEACRAAPKSTADLVPVLFTRKLDPHQMSFAFSETLAHVNFMVKSSALSLSKDVDGVERARTI